MKPITREPTFYLLLLLLLFLVGVDLYYAQLYHYNVIDDAYISFQYAKNLILGNGLVFNPGERVEGYTNFLWIVFLAPIYFLSTLLHFDFTTAAIFLNVALALVDVVILYRISRRIFQNDWIAVSFVLLFTVLDNSFQVYAMSGMENHLVILWMLLSIDLSLKETRCQPYWLGLVFALACMTRPDAGLFVGAYFLTRRFHWRTLGFFCFVFGVYFIWRYFYYGDILPNTYHLKVGKGLGALTRGWEYTKSFFEDRYYLPLLSITALFGISQPLIRWLLVFLLLQIAYVTYVGGDFYTGQRFYLVLIPIMALLMGTSLQHFSLWLKQWERGGDWRVLPAIWLSLWFIFFVMRGYERGPYQSEIVRWHQEVDNNVRYMKWLKTIAPPGASMVVGDIGATGFFADVRVIDVFGVVDPVIAHSQVTGFGQGKPGHEKRGEAAYLLQKKPTYIKWGYIDEQVDRTQYDLMTDFPSDLKVPGLWVRKSQ